MSVPSLLECLPPLRRFPGVAEARPISMTQWESLYAQYAPREEEIAIPSTLGPSTRQADLPTSPPPAIFWRLKKLAPSANVMDYWIKAENAWDLEGIESDLDLELQKVRNSSF